MKLKKVVIENFKRFEHLSLDLTDARGRVREVTLIAGPNGSGKTTLLEAIAYPLTQVMSLPFPKSTLGLREEDLIGPGGKFPVVTCDLCLDPEEHKAVARLAQRLDPGWRVSEERHGQLVWTLPMPVPAPIWTWLRGRKYAYDLIRKGQESARVVEQVGGVYYFDQERSLIPQLVRKAEHRTPILPEEIQTIGPEDGWGQLKTYLVSLGVDAKLEASSWQAQAFEEIRRGYAHLFAPREMVGVVPREDYRDLLFRENGQEYLFEGLSSGEKQGLLFLTEFARRRIHRSIVLIDEVELHFHPTLQIDFLKWLPKLGQDNQFILTTHSPYVERFYPRDCVFTFGALTEPSSDDEEAMA
jgi:predicted ATPase